ncbi:hypothetical protein DMN91_003689 [Ooceraea biroi]|uniref:Ribonuclease P protein subunit p21 n=1 Tax=Ooceraea biroi TaxID=2015173 RepID=A0A026X003_OOCBI|nr:ribonuclease P protein subunit p21 [Ooceraea biroi]EZA61428.1 Ribonuclease P protein subunit p21 [Ooceraea biroi]RLU23484.1 hypothetical protein DMN91_003689 [Ooceraea biroi]
MGSRNKSCQHKDVFERMNFLYQASRLMVLKNRSVASYYGNNMIGCAKKAVLRIEPDLKRTMCKRCQTPLIPGETARVRLTSKPVKCVKWTCLTCTNAKRFPTKKGYKLWLDQPEAVIEMLDYTPQSKKNTQKSDAQEKVANIDEEAKE